MSPSSLRAQPLDIPALAGGSPQEVAFAMGEPVESTVPEDEEGFAPIADMVYALSGGGQVSVMYCGVEADGGQLRAVSFVVRLDNPSPTAEALLARVGLPPGQLTLFEEGPGHVEWGASPEPEAQGPAGATFERAVATQSAEGWSHVIVDYSLPC